MTLRRESVSQWLVSLSMRAAAVITVFACLALIGCASHRDKSDGFSLEEYRRVLAAVADKPVPLPQWTPYDSEPEGKDAYLNSYQEGYRTGLTGYYITALSEGGPYHRERVAGYYAGLSAGWQVWSQNNLGPGAHFFGERPAKPQTKVQPALLDQLGKRLAAIFEDLKTVPIPMPQTTPFDDNPRRRDFYRVGFRDGWDFAISGRILCASQITPVGIESDYASEWEAGARDGRKLGGDEVLSRLKTKK